MMTASVFIVAFLGLLLQDQASAELLEENCGVGYESDSSMKPKIFDGHDAITGSNPWIALLLTPGKDGQPPSFFCAGTLITECFVLTAAHCLLNKTNIIVRLGEYDRSSTNHTGKVDINVIAAHIYKEYDPQTHLNDIALLRLSRCVSYNEYIKPICIQLDSRRKSLMDAITKFTVVGWGKTRSQDTSNVLQTVTLDRLPNSRCNEVFWNNDTSTQICAGSNLDGAAACGGDSGGPLYTTGRYGGVRRQTQLGIISYGTRSCQGVGVFTNVMSYVAWIEKIVLESDIEVVVPKIEFLDKNCISDSTTKSRTSAFPWLAYVYIDSFPLALGTLISDSFVISTALAYPEGAPLNVGLGRKSGHTEVIHKVGSVYKHPNFERFSENDIALLELAVKIQYTDHIRPICIPFLNETSSFREKAVKAEHLVVIGFDQQSSEIVQRLNSTSCYNGNYQKIGKNQTCFQHPKSTRLASGSPLVRRFSHGLVQAYTLVGMASFGRSDRRGPDVYTDVLSYSKWIHDMGLTLVMTPAPPNRSL